MKIGLGLWTMRSTAAFPASWPRLYEQLRADAQLTESLGFHSLWIAEHHFWYDGWTPSPLVAAASALAATSTLHVGTGIHLLPLHDRDRVTAQICECQRLSGGRFECGVGLGYRAGEYDGYGLSRKSRGRRMDAALERLAELRDLAPPVWVGGFATPAVQRAGRFGLGLMLPSTLSLRQLRQTIESAQATAAESGSSVPIGAMKYAWATDGSKRQRRWAIDMLGQFTREYSGAWFPLDGRPGFEVPELLEGQMARSAQTSLIGPPEEIVSGLQELEAAGVGLCVLHLIGDARLPQLHEQMVRIAERVLPAFRRDLAA